VILLGWTAAWGQTPAPEVDPADKSASVNADQQTIAKQLNHPPLGFVKGSNRRLKPALCA